MIGMSIKVKPASTKVGRKISIDTIKSVSLAALRKYVKFKSLIGFLSLIPAFAQPSSEGSKISTCHKKLIKLNNANMIGVKPKLSASHSAGNSPLFPHSKSDLFYSIIANEDRVRGAVTSIILFSSYLNNYRVHNKIY